MRESTKEEINLANNTWHAAELHGPTQPRRQASVYSGDNPKTLRKVGLALLLIMALFGVGAWLLMNANNQLAKQTQDSVASLQSQLTAALKLKSNKSGDTFAGPVTLLQGQQLTAGGGVSTQGGSVDAGTGSITGGDITANNATITNTLNVGGATVLGGSLQAASTTLSSLIVSGSSSLNALAVSGATTLASSFAVSGNSTLNNLTVNGTSTLGQLSAGSANFTSLSVTGPTTLANTLSVLGDFSVNTNKFTVSAASGNTLIGGTLGVTGNTSLSTLSTTGASLFGGAVTLNSIGNTGGTLSLCIDGSNAVVTCGTGGLTTLQNAYNAGNAIITTDARDLQFTLSNTATDANFLVNVASGSTSRFAVQKNGVDTFSVDTNGSALFKNTANSTTAFQVQDATGAPLLVTDTSNRQILTGDINPLTAGTIATGRVITTVTPVSGFYNEGSSWMVTAPSGFPAMAVLDSGSTQVKYVACNDADCASSTPTIIDNDSNDFEYEYLRFGSDNQPRILYENFDPGNNEIILARYVGSGGTGCATAAWNCQVVASGDHYEMSFALGPDDMGRIAYREYNDDQLHFIHCLNLNCTSSNTNIIDTLSTDIEPQSIQVGADGNTLLAYIDYTTSPDQLKFAQCTDADCSPIGVTITTIDTDTHMWYLSMLLGNDGFGRVVYRTSDGVRYIQCTNTSCSSHTPPRLLDTDADAVSAYLGNDGFVRVGYSSFNDTQGKFLRCTDDACTTPVLSVVTTSGFGAYPIAADNGPDGFPRIAVADTLQSGTAHASLIRLQNQDGTDSIDGVSIGNTSPFKSVNAKAFIGGRLTLTADPGQTADLLNIQDATGTNLVRTDSNGDTTFRTTVNAAGAFQIQNADGTSLFSVDSTAPNTNFLTNGGFELPLAGTWQSLGGATITQNSQVNLNVSGEHSLTLSTNGVGGEGVKQNVTLSDSNAFKFSFYATYNTSSPSSVSLEAGYSNDGTPGGETDCALSSSTISNSNTFKRFECEVDTPPSHSGTPYVYIKQTDATATSINIDNALLGYIFSHQLYADSGINFNGAITSTVVFAPKEQSEDAFVIQDASSHNLLSTDSQESSITLGNFATFNQSFGKLAIGVSSAPITGGSFSTSRIQITDESGLNSDILQQVANGGWAVHNFSASRGTIEVPLANNSGDVLGAIAFYGYDGVSDPATRQEATAITSQVEATPQANIVSGKLLFQTASASTGGALITRAVINESGLNIIGGVKNTGGITSSNLAAPAAPTVTPTGTTGATTWTYTVTAVSTTGETVASTATSIANGNATLDGTNFNVISWAAVTGATSYKVYRTVAGGTPNTTGLIGTSTGLSLSDTGLSGSGAASPTTNNSGRVGIGTTAPTAGLDVRSDAVFKNASNSTTGFQIQNAAGTTLMGIDTSNGRIFSGIANGASAIGFSFNTTNSFSTAGAKLISIQNATVEKFAIDKDGNVFVISGAAVAFQGSGNAKNVVTKKFVCTAATSAGDVVVIDTANAGQVTTTTTANNAKVAGVVSIGSGAGGTCDVAISGTIQATMTTAGAVAVGDLLVTSGTGGQGQTNNTPSVGTVFGKALSAKSAASAGTVWVLLSNF